MALFRKDKITDTEGNLNRRKVTPEVKTALINGDMYVSSLKVIQALEPATELLNTQISMMSGIIEDFYKRGGNIRCDRDALGCYHMVSSWESVKLEIDYGIDGKMTRKEMQDSSLGNVDSDAIQRLNIATYSFLELPKRRFAVDEIKKLKDIINNTTAIQSLDQLKQLFSQSPDLMFDMMSMPESSTSDTIMDALGKGQK